MSGTAVLHLRPTLPLDPNGLREDRFVDFGPSPTKLTVHIRCRGQTLAEFGCSSCEPDHTSWYAYAVNSGNRSYGTYLRCVSVYGSTRDARFR